MIRSPSSLSSTSLTALDRFAGCLLAGAVGDALGAQIEFMQREEITTRFGPRGLDRYVAAYGGIGRITDDTQMTLFTADGLIRTAVRGAHKGIASVAGVTAHAYLRWLMTQTGPIPHALVFGMEQSGWLYPLKALHARRAPGITCLSALQAMSALGEPARNDSKGCGGVMRVAPVGLWMAANREPSVDELCFRLACELARLTHGHPTGQLTAGVFAVMVRRLAMGSDLHDALDLARRVLVKHPRCDETLCALDRAAALGRSCQRQALDSKEHAEHIASLGEGWVAEEALAISIYCALVADDLAHGVVLSINHSGDSDSTGSMTGNLLGSIHGVQSIPTNWLAPLELRTEIESVARDLCHYGEADWRDPALPDIDAPETFERYPGY